MKNTTIPQSPNQSFAGDNVAGAHPHVIEALSAANTGSAAPYGDDPWTRRATRRFRDLLEVDVEPLFTYGGTGANVVALQSVLAPHDAVIYPSTAHINTDECGATERFIGAKLIDIASEDGKLHPEAIADLLRPARGEHNVHPKVLAISQVTELGSVYTIDEITRLAELDNASHANNAAALLANHFADTPYVEILGAPEANTMFALIPEHAIEPLEDWSFFWTWDASKNLVRWMTSFATTEADITRFAEGVHHFTRPTAREEHSGAAQTVSPCSRSVPPRIRSHWS